MRTVLASAVMLIVLGNLACQRREKSADRINKPAAKTALAWASEAANLRSADKKEDAVKAYDEALKLDPNLEVAIYNRALIYAELSRDEEAAAARDDLIKRNSPLAKKLYALFSLNSDANVSMADKHAKAHEWDLALAKYKVALIYNPSASEAYVGRGIVWGQQKKYDEAIREFDQAIKLDPKSPIAYHNRGRANIERKQFRAAVDDFTQAIALAPTDPTQYEGRAAAYAALNDRANAEADRKKAADLKSKSK